MSGGLDCQEHRHLRRLLGNLRDHSRDLSQPSLLVADRGELRPVRGERIGLGALGADGEALLGELLDSVQVTAKQSDPHLGLSRHPCQHRLRYGVRDGKGRMGCGLGFFEAPRPGGLVVHPDRTPEECEWIAEVSRDRLGLPQVGQLLLEGRGDPDGHRAVVDYRDECRRLPQPASHQHRLVKKREPPLGRSECELRAQRREQPGPFRALGSGKRREGLLENLDLLRVDVAERRRIAAMVGQSGGDQPVGLADAEGCVRRLEQCGPELGDPGLALGGSEPDQAVDAGDGVGRRALVEKLERLGEVAHRFVGGERSQGRLAGAHGMTDRFLRVGWSCRQEVVIGELAGVRRVLAEEMLQCLCHLQVGAGSAGRPQPVVESPLDERMRKGVAARSVRSFPHEHTRPSRVEEIEERLVVLAADFGEQVEVKVPPDHRGD